MANNEIIDLLQNQDERLKKIESLLSVSKAVLNIDEVSQLIGLSKSTIYKNTMNGTIPHFKQCKHLYFDRVEIENWLKSNRGLNIDEIELEASSSLSINRGGVK
jgi:excisionase family DNA binding protein